MSETLFDLSQVESERIKLPDDVNLAWGRITVTFAAATQTEHDSGMNWYFGAHNLCQEWSQEFGHPVDVIAGIVASLSPLETWNGNVKNALTLLRTGDVRTMGRSKEDALAILHSQDPEGVLYAETKNNPKVRAFFENIRDPEGSSAVTIDRHMISMLAGVKLPAKEQWIPPKENERAAVWFRGVAQMLGIKPHQVQAVTWNVWRRMHGFSSLGTVKGAGASENVQITLGLDD
ncbi:MAG: hypothetical protein AAF413_04155 [Patescibacteria group bacterium]